MVGSVLTGTNGTWAGSATITFVYAWLADGVVIVGATTNSYTSTSAELGKVLSLRVTATNSGGTVAATSSVTGAVIPLPPENVTRPLLSGQAVVGESLSGTDGTWDGSPTGFTYVWRENGVPISSGVGTTSTSYILTTAQLGKVISFRVFATNAGGTTFSTSLGTAAVIDVTPPPPPVAPLPVNTTLPSITGNAIVGQTLTGSVGVWTGSPTYVRQWKADGVNIAGATGTTLALTSIRLNEAITFQVTGTNGSGSTIATSAATSPVVNLTPPVNTTLPSITGSALVGQTLT
ncbi:MAG: hypothetical protein M3R04_05935, partial [bacterium]|nr:hypothetical protein [bacterium]